MLLCYGNGGQGIAYADTTAGNSGGAFRTTDVDLAAAQDTGGFFVNFGIAALATAIALVMAYPMGYYIGAVANPRYQGMLLMMVLTPLGEAASFTTCSR